MNVLYSEYLNLRLSNFSISNYLENFFKMHVPQAHLFLEIQVIGRPEHLWF